MSLRFATLNLMYLVNLSLLPLELLVLSFNLQALFRLSLYLVVIVSEAVHAAGAASVFGVVVVAAGLAVPYSWRRLPIP